MFLLICEDFFSGTGMVSLTVQLGNMGECECQCYCHFSVCPFLLEASSRMTKCLPRLVPSSVQREVTILREKHNQEAVPALRRSSH